MTHARRSGALQDVNLALALYRQQQWDAAAGRLERLLAHDSTRDDLRIALGDCLLRLHRPRQAAECFARCLGSASQAPALFGQAVACQMLRRFDESEAAYGRFLEWEPRSEEALANLVALSMERLDMDRVQRYAGRLLEIAPDSCAALQGLIVAAASRGDFGQAGIHLQRLLELLPRSQIFRNDPAVPSDRLDRDENGTLLYFMNRAGSERLARTHHSFFEPGAVTGIAARTLARR